jgi:hypothetical protein
MSEWITDRMPTEEDSDEKYKLWLAGTNGHVMLCHYEDIKTGEVWAPKPKPVVPKPYVKPEPKRWKPEIGERYHYVTSRAKIYSGIYEQAYELRAKRYFQNMYEAGNCFQTVAQAQEAARRVRQLLLNYHKELNNE